MSRFETRVLIRESYIDFLGHVNNAAYLQIFEEVRWDFITRNGYGVQQIRQYQKGPVILDCHIRFMKEIQVREEIVVTVENVAADGKAGQKVFQMRQQMITAQGEVACEAMFSYGLFDLCSRRLIEPTVEWTKAVGI